MPQVASVGRIVHYVMNDRTVRPATIVHVWSDNQVDLVVTLGLHDGSEVLPYSASGRNGFHVGVGCTSLYEVKEGDPLPIGCAIWPPFVPPKKVDEPEKGDRN